MSYPIASNETERLAVLQNLSILDTNRERPFDLVTAMAKDIFGMPMVAISLVAEDRQWFKSEVGLCTHETPRAPAFCNYTILSDEVFEVTDAAVSALFAGSPLVTEPPYIRYYCGAPIVAMGFRLGAFCILDSEPRPPLQANGVRILMALAEQVGREIENRKVLRQAMALLAAPNVA